MQHIYADKIYVKAQLGSIVRWAVEDSFILSKNLSATVILTFNGKEITCDYRNGDVESAVKKYFD